MKASTVAALDRINRNFYRERASEFSETRKRPWIGWEKVFELIDQNLGQNLDSTRISILDLGCGNGRLLPGLERAFGAAISYLGLDVSISMLARAARTLRSAGCSRANLLAADLVHRPLTELLPTARLDVVLAFGLMHHLPSLELRRELLASAGERLRPAGLLAVSFWQFADKERFRRRFVSWDALPAHVGRLDPRDLEKGDHLLAWGNSGAMRYCHHASPAEAEQLVGSVGLRSVASFSADGESGTLNLYYLLRRASTGTVSV